MPFVHGGAEIHVRELVRELRERGYLAELVSVPYKWYPKDEILPHAAAWRLLDLSESNGTPIDRVIASKFPTYFVRHPHKVAWLDSPIPRRVRALRYAVQRLSHTEQDVGLRETLIRLDTEMLGECRSITRTHATQRRGSKNSTASPPTPVPSAASREENPRRANTATTCSRWVESNQ